MTLKRVLGRTSRVIRRLVPARPERVSRLEPKTPAARALKWIRENHLPTGGIRARSGCPNAYPEATGCRKIYPETLDAVLTEVARRRCAECHTNAKIPRREWTRITEPELNPFLTAPLAKSAGGTEQCGTAVFTSIDDPDYRPEDDGYVALLEGWLADDQGRITVAIAKDKNHFPRVIICDATGKEAISEYTVLQRLEHPRRSLVQFTPHTGRTHQLRVHSQSIGHPILGCDLYKSDRSERLADRLLLHASDLYFKHPDDGEQFHGQCPSPF